METEEFQCAGTLEKPALAYVTKNDRKGGIRFYVKIEGSIKAMKYKFCKVDGSFFVYCCTQQGLNCEAKHLIRCKEEALMRYNKSSRVWRLNFDHHNIYSPSSFEVVYSETCPHTCKVSYFQLMLRSMPWTFFSLILPRTFRSWRGEILKVTKRSRLVRTLPILLPQMLKV